MLRTHNFEQLNLSHSTFINWVLSIILRNKVRVALRKRRISITVLTECYFNTAFKDLMLVSVNDFRL